MKTEHKSIATTAIPAPTNSHWPRVETAAIGCPQPGHATASGEQACSQIGQKTADSCSDSDWAIRAAWRVGSGAAAAARSLIGLPILIVPPPGMYTPFTMHSGVEHFDFQRERLLADITSLLRRFSDEQLLEARERLREVAPGHPQPRCVRVAARSRQHAARRGRR